MSEYEIPFHIQEEIMKKLPVKSLIQFRSVSKAWKSLIDSSQFIAAHSLHTQPHHLLVSYEDPQKELNCVCFDDDDTFPQHMSILILPLSVKQLAFPNIVGISHGLVCFYCNKTKLAVIWNPSIRKSIDVAVPNTPYVGQHFVGFGVCPATSDPKVVSIKQSWDKANIETGYQYEVMVYTLSSNNWRSLSTNLPTIRIHEWLSPVAADGFINWRGGSAGHNMIISFDVTNETFQRIDLPDTLARDRWPLHIYKLRESLAILRYDRSTSTYAIWKMEGGVQRSFTKLFTLNTRYFIMAFRKSGVPILKVIDDEQSKLAVYEPNSEHNNVLDIPGDPFYFKVYSYMETLLLLGRKD